MGRINRSTTPKTGSADELLRKYCVLGIHVRLHSAGDKALRSAFQLTGGEAISRFEGLAALNMTPKSQHSGANLLTCSRVGFTDTEDRNEPPESGHDRSLQSAQGQTG